MKKLYIFLSMLIIVCICFTLFNKVSFSNDDIETYSQNENKNTSRPKENKEQNSQKDTSDSNNEKETTQTKKEKNNYSQIKTISFSEFEKIVTEQEKLVVIVSSSACSHCLNFEPVVNKVLTELNSSIYRLDILSLTIPDKNKLDTYYTITGTPTLLSIKNGIVIDATSGEKTEASFKEWYENQLKDN